MHGNNGRAAVVQALIRRPLRRADQSALSQNRWELAGSNDIAFPNVPTCFVAPKVREGCHGLIVSTTALESFPVHPITNVFPIAPETEVVFPLGGLNTSTSTDPGAAMSAAVIAASSC